MARPAVYTIPAHVPAADALAEGLMARASGVELARALVLLPNRRATVALTAAFVRRAEGGGLLLPRMRAVADAEDADLPPAAIGDEAAVPPAIEEAERRLMLAGMLRRLGHAPAEALRMAASLGGALDTLVREEVAPSALAEVAPAELAGHWQQTWARLQLIAREWPGVLEKRGRVDAARRRVLLQERLAWRWAQDGAGGRLVAAAGITDAAPAVARLLRAVARLPGGMVVLPGLDLAMSEAAWEGLEAGDPASEAHPQFALKRLLGAMGVARGEVELWGHGRAGPAARVAAVQGALAPARFPAAVDGAALADVRLVEAATPAEEAQVVALAMRRALEETGRTAALVTPDRGLARRVAGHLARWELEVADTAGVPLGETPPGVLLRLLATAAGQRFAPAALLAVLKHPLVTGGGERLAWLDAVRALDMDLRGPAPRVGLEGVEARLRACPKGWWREVAVMLAPLGEGRADGLPAALRRLLDTASALAGDMLWAGLVGRELAGVTQRLLESGEPLGVLAPDELRGALDVLLAEAVVRPPFGGHPRLAIYGLLEARLQRADLMILGGLNEGMWPAQPAPDPWLPPAVRAALGLPAAERRVGLAAHDFVQAMGAREVLLTRARRDASAPVVASRLLMRLEAAAGGALREDGELLGWARALDRPGEVKRAVRPEPAPPAELRPRRMAVTKADVLRADPFSFYAEAMLGLKQLDGVGCDPTAADRGRLAHAILEAWVREGARPEALEEAVAAAFTRWNDHPLVQALWRPRLKRAVEWAAGAIAERGARGWVPLAVEAEGELELSGVTLKGRADRVDAGREGWGLVDYKTGEPPSPRQVIAGYALQLGLLGLMADRGALDGVGADAVADLSYWRLSGGTVPGGVKSVLSYRDATWQDASGFVAHCVRHFERCAEALLLGSAPFVPKLKPEYARNYKAYDQLARLEEWEGRD